jgi:hypothetical protein
MPDPLCDHDPAKYLSAVTNPVNFECSREAQTQRLTTVQITCMALIKLTEISNVSSENCTFWNMPA